MIISESTPNRQRIIQEKAYVAEGITDMAFNIPQPFLPAMFEDLREELGIDPVGLARQVNQVYAENLANNMASRIKKAAGKEDMDLPTQVDMDELAAAYDFSVRTATAAFGSTFDKIFHRIASGFIRKLLKKKGYQDTPAPVTVAKKNAETTEEGQISFEDFEVEVIRLTEGEGPWGEKDAFIDLRETLKQEALAEETRLRNAEKETEDKLAAISLDSGDAPEDSGEDSDYTED